MTIFDLDKAPIDIDEYPYVMFAGGNKMGVVDCPTCGAKPLEAPLIDGSTSKVFPFRDELSTREYQISGMCQKCQDETFIDWE